MRKYCFALTRFYFSPSLIRFSYLSALLVDRLCDCNGNDTFDTFSLSKCSLLTSITYILQCRDCN